MASGDGGFLRRPGVRLLVGLAAAGTVVVLLARDPHGTAATRAVDLLGTRPRIIAAVGLVALEYFLALRYLPKVTLVSLALLVVVARSDPGTMGRTSAFAVAVLLAPVFAAVVFWTLGLLWKGLFGRGGG